MRESRFVQEVSRAVRSGAENMPILTGIVRPIAAFFGAGGSAGPVRRSCAVSGSGVRKDSEPEEQRTSG